MHDLDGKYLIVEAIVESERKFKVPIQKRSNTFSTTNTNVRSSAINDALETVKQLDDHVKSYLKMNNTTSKRKMEESESETEKHSKDDGKKGFFSKRDFNNQFYVLAKQYIPVEHNGKTISWLKANGFEAIINKIRKELVNYLPQGLTFSSCWADLQRSNNTKRYANNIVKKLKSNETNETN